MKTTISLSFILLSVFANAQTLKPTTKMALLTGTVTNFKNVTLANEILLLVNNKTKKSYSVHTNNKGLFQLLIPVSATYSLKYKNFTSDVDYTKMVVPSDADATYEVQIKIEPPKEFVLQNVQFDTGKSSLKATSNKALNDLVEILKIKTTMIVEIQGHTDNVGNSDENLKLSQARAETVKQYLISKGITENRLTAKGYGDKLPIANNDTNEGKTKNRRTSLKVIKE